eukprot:365318-Chlamydomonas_euryale.AAC.6
MAAARCALAAAHSATTRSPSQAARPCLVPQAARPWLRQRPRQRPPLLRTPDWSRLAALEERGPDGAARRVVASGTVGETGQCWEAWRSRRRRTPPAAAWPAARAAAPMSPPPRPRTRPPTPASARPVEVATRRLGAAAAAAAAVTRAVRRGPRRQRACARALAPPPSTAAAAAGAPAPAAFALHATRPPTRTSNAPGHAAGRCCQTASLEPHGTWPTNAAGTRRSARPSRPWTAGSASARAPAPAPAAPRRRGCPRPPARLPARPCAAAAACTSKGAPTSPTARPRQDGCRHSRASAARTRRCCTCARSTCAAARPAGCANAAQRAGRRARRHAAARHAQPQRRLRACAVDRRVAGSAAAAAAAAAEASARRAVAAAGRVARVDARAVERGAGVVAERSVEDRCGLAEVHAAPGALHDGRALLADEVARDVCAQVAGCGQLRCMQQAAAALGSRGLLRAERAVQQADVALRRPRGSERRGGPLWVLGAALVVEARRHGGRTGDARQPAAHCDAGATAADRRCGRLLAQALGDGDRPDRAADERPNAERKRREERARARVARQRRRDRYLCRAQYDGGAGCARTQAAATRAAIG